MGEGDIVLPGCAQDMKGGLARGDQTPDRAKRVLFELGEQPGTTLCGLGLGGESFHGNDGSLQCQQAGALWHVVEAGKFDEGSAACGSRLDLEQATGREGGNPCRQQQAARQQQDAAAKGRIRWLATKRADSSIDQVRIEIVLEQGAQPVVDGTHVNRSAS